MNLLITEVHHSFASVVLQAASAQEWRPCVFAAETGRSLLPSGIVAHSGHPREALRDADALVFCNPMGSMESRLPLLEAALEAGTPRIVLVSSCLVFGSTGERPLDENALDAHPAFDLRPWLERGAPIIAVHPATLFGKGLREDDAWLNRLIRRASENKGLPPIADGGGAFTLSLSDDVARGLAAALEQGQPGRRYILGGETVSLVGFMQSLFEVLEREAPFRPAPLWRARLYAWTEKRITQALTGYAPHNGRESLALARENRRFSSQRAIAELGYARTPLKIALHKTLDAMGFRTPSGPELLG